MVAPRLSVVVPCFAARERASRALATLQAFLEAEGLESELLLVDRGSPVGERPRAEDLPPGAVSIQLEGPRGWGYAVQAGMFAARGRSRLALDVELPWALQAIPSALRRLEREGCHAVVGVPAEAGAGPWGLLTRLGRSGLAAGLGLAGVEDVAPGFLACSAPLAQAVFPLLALEGPGFLVELLLALRENEVPVARVPLRQVETGRREALELRQVPELASALVGLRLRRRLGCYASAALRELMGTSAPGGAAPRG